MWLLGENMKRTIQKILDDIENLPEWDLKDRQIHVELKNAVDSLEFVLDKTLGV